MGHKVIEINRQTIAHNVSNLGARLVHCNDYYMGIGISITRNILSWNVISIIIH